MSIRLAIFFVFIALCSAWDNTYTLNNQLTINWNVDGSTITMRCSVPTSSPAWIGIGWNAASGGMSNVDMVCSSQSSPNNGWTVQDYYSSGFSTPTVDTQQNVYNTYAGYANGQSYMQFTRALTTTDTQQDTPIPTGPCSVVYGVGSSPVYDMHTLSGSGTVTFCNASSPAPAQAPAQAPQQAKLPPATETETASSPEIATVYGSQTAPTVNNYGQQQVNGPFTETQPETNQYWATSPETQSVYGGNQVATSPETAYGNQLWAATPETESVNGTQSSSTSPQTWYSTVPAPESPRNVGSVGSTESAVPEPESVQAPAPLLISPAPTLAACNITRHRNRKHSFTFNVSYDGVLTTANETEYEGSPASEGELNYLPTSYRAPSSPESAYGNNNNQGLFGSQGMFPENNIFGTGAGGSIFQGNSMFGPSGNMFGSSNNMFGNGGMFGGESLFPATESYGSSSPSYGNSGSSAPSYGNSGSSSPSYGNSGSSAPSYGNSGSSAPSYGNSNSAPEYYSNSNSAPEYYSNSAPSYSNSAPEYYSNSAPEYYSNSAPEYYSNSPSEYSNSAPEYYSNSPSEYSNSAPEYYSNSNSAPEYYSNSAPQYYSNSAPEYYSNSNSAPEYYSNSAPTQYYSNSAPEYYSNSAPTYSAPQYSAPTYSAPQYSAPQYSAPQYSAPTTYSAPMYSAPTTYSAPVSSSNYNNNVPQQVLPAVQPPSNFYQQQPSASNTYYPIPVMSNNNQGSYQPSTYSQNVAPTNNAYYQR